MRSTVCGAGTERDPTGQFIPVCPACRSWWSEKRPELEESGGEAIAEGDVHRIEHMTNDVLDCSRVCRGYGFTNPDLDPLCHACFVDTFKDTEYVVSAIFDTAIGMSHSLDT
ncbi:uncharacterized protein EHS24_000804 [Apiotrichum porosum]|uniref:Uncharacterized protein n=1 Tax=Apiotrichum porosum TaxID=105984 RepID=A0A427YAU1_9TREE|nr:uncharacterized protein EHS24_000804 [Apiotrichum porosum]RSH88270.1 hypothetical protein EHS24_000804 [Apiotrichum porosum]